MDTTKIIENPLLKQARLIRLVKKLDSGSDEWYDAVIELLDVNIGIVERTRRSIHHRYKPSIIDSALRDSGMIESVKPACAIDMTLKGI